MIRNFAIAFTALAAIGVASLASTAPAEAGGWKGKHHHFHGHKHWGHGHRHYRPVYYGGCWRKVWVGGRYNGYFKRINVCY